MPRPISVNEFRELFERCTPPRGWPKKLAVANSGGPDSTCLLFLIRRLLQEVAGNKCPESVVSLTVDHRLQKISSAMAEHCRMTAATLGVEHIMMHIPWSEPPFPPLPTRSFEKIARDARYHVLFHAMTHSGSEAIAFGHHADDQVETALLRSAMGTTEFGAAGMRPCRRWGMGFGDGEGALGWAGGEGMRRWVVRPLLTVPKSRILATCNENALEYVTDPTNFQPEVTIRNAIRQSLAQQSPQESSGKLASPSSNRSLATQDSVVNEDLRLSAAFSLRQGLEHMYTAVELLSNKRELIDSIVTQKLQYCRRESPPSTVLLAVPPLHTVEDPSVQRALVLRVLRYVSFYPWGSLRAEAHRRSASLSRIVDSLWCLSPQRRSFVGGGGVLWTPVTLTKGGYIKMEQKSVPQKVQDASLAWIASRQPPLAKSLTYLDAGARKGPLHVDLTHLIHTRTGDAEKIELLWDCRFLLQINLNRLTAIKQQLQSSTSSQDYRLIVEPETRWYLPRVMLYWNDRSLVLARPKRLYSADTHALKPCSEHRLTIREDNAITIEEARVLDAL